MKNLISKHFAAALAALIVLTVAGGWRIGLFEASDQSQDVSGGELVAAFIGFIVFLGGLAGIVLLIRQNMKPWSDEQVSQWKHVREQGRRAYMQDAIIKGLILAFIAVACLSIIDYWKARSFRLILDSAWIYGALFLVYLFGMYYMARRSWNANEKHYQNRIQSLSRNE